MTFAGLKEFVRTRKGGVLSTLFHVLLICWGLISLSAGSVEALPPQDFVPVDVVSDEKLSQLTKGLKTGDKNEKKQQAEKVAAAKPLDEAIGKVDKKEILTSTVPEPKPVEKPPEKPVEKKPDPPKPVVEKPKEEPKKEEAKQVEKKEEKIDPIAEQLKKDQAKQPPKPETAKPQPPKERAFDPKQIADKLKKDRALDDKRDPTRMAMAGEELNSKSALGVSAGTAQKLTLSWVGALQNRIAQCWNVPAGIRDGQNIQIRVYFELNRNGALAARPQLLAGPPTALGPAVAESAIRAVEKCQPYNFLPQNEYSGGWDKLDLELTTDSMFRR